jgi:hypothetical protein
MPRATFWYQLFVWVLPEFLLISFPGVKEDAARKVNLFHSRFSKWTTEMVLVWIDSLPAKFFRLYPICKEMDVTGGMLTAFSEQDLKAFFFPKDDDESRLLRLAFAAKVNAFREAEKKFELVEKQEHDEKMAANRGPQHVFYINNSNSNTNVVTMNEADIKGRSTAVKVFCRSI